MPVIDLGCFSHCDTIDTTVEADVSGTYILRQKFNGQIIDIPIEVTTPPENLTFSPQSSGLNENYTYVSQIVSTPAGSAIDTTNTYQFKIEVKI